VETVEKSVSFVKKRDTRWENEWPRLPSAVDNEWVTEVRAATPQDALGVARVHVRSWQVAYRGLVAQDYLDRLRPADKASRCTFGRRGPEMQQR
jgi:hypothetical protein